MRGFAVGQENSKAKSSAASGGFAEVAPILAAAGYRVLMPCLRSFGATRFRSAAMEGVANGAPHPDPAAFAKAIIDADRLA
jgi:hypothetical protein